MKLKFVRYGGLSSVPQKGYDSAMPGPHNPPARRGIYAMPEQAISTALFVTNCNPYADSEFDPRRMEWVRDEAGNPILADSEEAKKILSGKKPTRFGGKPKYCKIHTANATFYLARIRNPKTFVYDGELWHHLCVPRNEILLERGEWVLTTSHAHRLAFSTEYNKLSHKYQGKLNKGHFDDTEFIRFEVFIEKI